MVRGRSQRAIVNRALIADAPEMAEALELWRAYDEGADDVSMMIRYAEAIEATRALLARIRGKAT
jgi:hypothetical protein